MRSDDLRLTSVALDADEREVRDQRGVRGMARQALAPSESQTLNGPKRHGSPEELSGSYAHMT